MNLSKPNTHIPCPKGSKAFQPTGTGKLWAQNQAAGKEWRIALDRIKSIPQKDRLWRGEINAWELSDTKEIRDALIQWGFVPTGIAVGSVSIGMPGVPTKKELAPWIAPWKDLEVPQYYNHKGEGLREYQREGLQMLKYRGGRGGLFLDPGLGKTATGLCWVRMNPEITRVVVLATASTKHQWKQSAREWGVPFFVLPVSGKTPGFLPKTGICCLNWEILPPDEPTKPKTITAIWTGTSETHIPGIEANVVPGKNKIKIPEWEGAIIASRGLEIYTLDQQAGTPYSYHTHGPRLVEQAHVPRKLLPGWLATLLAWDPQTVIADEFHLHAADPDSQRTRALTKLVEGRGFVPMSGSPMRTHVRQLFPVLHLLDPKEFPDKWRFYTRYCEGESRFGKNWDGAHNLEELHQKIRKVGIRYTKEELPDLPARVFNAVMLDCTPSKEYMEAQDRFLKLQGTDTNDMKKRMEALSASAFNEKKQAVLDWVADFLESDRKLLLLCWHRVVAEFLEASLGKQCVRLGDTGREATIRRFIDDPKCRVFIGNITAAGTGIDGLQEVCSDVAFVELCGSPADLDQGSSRLHRMGQKGCVTAHFLLAPDTVDVARLATLGWRDQNASLLIDGQTEDDALDSLVAMLKKIDGTNPTQKDQS